MIEWPEWWSWDVELSPHLLERMIDRKFNELDLQLMLDRAVGYHENHEEGRWAIETELAGRSWEVIVEPVQEEKVLVVVTAYPIE